jgi:hypothetical protein
MGPEPKDPSAMETLTDKVWTLQGISFDLGLEEKGTVVFGKGFTAVLGGDSMMALADSIPSVAGEDSLFPKGRACFYATSWESPGACILDDTWAFSPDGALTLDAGAALCSPDEPKTRTGTWSLHAGETDMTVVLGGDSATFRIEKRNPSFLRIAYVETDSGSGCGPAPVYVKTLYRFLAH